MPKLEIHIITICAIDMSRFWKAAETHHDVLNEGWVSWSLTKKKNHTIGEPKLSKDSFTPTSCSMDWSTQKICSPAALLMSPSGRAVVWGASLCHFLANRTFLQGACELVELVKGRSTRHKRFWIPNWEPHPPNTQNYQPLPSITERA